MCMPHVTFKLIAMSVLVTLVAGAPAGAQTLGFSQAREMVLTQHEGLKALVEEVAAAEAAVRQAGAYPNPEIEVETEKFGEAEVEVVLTQPLPIGGTRGAAINVAKREAEIADLTLESGKISVEAELVRRFIPLLAAHRRLELVDSLLEVSAKSTKAVQRLVDAGGAMALDVVRSQLEGDELLLERAEIVRSLAEGRAQLGELWGEVAPGFDRVEGTLPGTVDLPPADEVSAAMATHPDLLLLEGERRLIKAEMDEARAEGRPELALSAGYLRNNELDEGAAITGISFSLPIFNRNEAAVTEKHHEIAAAEHTAERERLERVAQLTTLYSEIEGTARDLDALSGELISKATYVHRSLEEFYVQGKTGILDVLEARSHLLELRMRILDLLEEQALLTADLVELTGYRIEIIN
jgi:cobalt-zinc-cadmium efflux system outer membrane protein